MSAAVRSATASAAAPGRAQWRRRCRSGTCWITLPLLPALELDLADHLRRDPGGNHARRQVLRDDRVRADHAALADLDPAGDHAVGAEPAVGPDPHRALGGEA